MRLIVVTGQSGAGKTTALHALEDAGFFAVDNLPPPLLPSLASMLEPHADRAAVVVDVRSRDFMAKLHETLDDTSSRVSELSVLFVESEFQHLVNRFKRTRRPHPLGLERLADSIIEEERLLEPLKRRATWVINTSYLNVHELRRRVHTLVLDGQRAPLHVSLVSFGFSHGILQEADLVFDVRFLPNPYFVPELSHLDGTDERVSGYVLKSEDARDFTGRLTSLLEYLLPRYEHEGKSYLTVGIGCSGGRHRSVSIAIYLSKIITGWGYGCSVSHRDKDRAL